MGISIYQALQNNKDSKKSSIGYTVSSYQGVLDDLEQQKVRQIERQVFNGTHNDVQYSSRNYTLLKTDSLESNYAQNNGFLFEKDTDKPLYQAICSLRDYMSFIVDANNKKAYVSVERGGESLKNGRALKQGITFPTSTGCDTSLKSLKESCSSCYVGVGISFSDLGLLFFTTYFKELKMTQALLDKIAGQGLLYAQIAIPIGNGSAKFFHSKVTTKYTGSTMGPYQVWMPIPILLLNDFSTFSSIIVNGCGKQTVVGQGGITFPLSGSHYYHKDASISGFTPNLIEQYLNATDKQAVSYVRSNLSSQGKQIQARVRLYLDRQAQGLLESIPEQYKKQLFKGYLTSDQVTSKETITLGGGNYYEFNSKGGIFIDVGHVGNVVSGSGTGAASAYVKNGKNVNEYWFNHRIAQFLARKLTELSIPVTIKDFPSKSNNEDRRLVKKQFLANEKDYVAFISIHCNSYGTGIVSDDTPGGSNVFVWGGSENPRHAQSDVLGNLLAAAMYPIMSGSRGSKKIISQISRVGILNGIKAPAVLLEVGFVNHKADCEKLADDATLDKLTNQMAKVIDTWIKSINN